MKKILILLICVFPSRYFSQLTLDLNQCIDLAFGNSILLKKDSIQIEIGRNNYVQSRAELLPTLNGSMLNKYNFGQVIDPYTNQFANKKVFANNVGVGSELVLFNGLSLVNTIKKQGYLVDLYENEEKLNEFNIKLELSSIYLEILMLDERIELYKNRLKQIDLKIVKQTQLSNRKNQIDLEIQRNTMELDLFDLEKDRKLKLNKLYDFIGIYNNQEILLVKPNIINLNNNLPNEDSTFIYNQIIKNHPEHLKDQLNLNVVTLNYQISKSKIMPKLTLNSVIASGYSGLKKETVGDPIITGEQVVGYTAGNELVYTPTHNYNSRVLSYKKQFNQNLNYSVGMSMTIPIFNKLSYRTIIQNNKLEVLKSTYQLEEGDEKIFNAYKNLQIDISSLKTKIDIQNKNLELQKELSVINENSYENGLISFLDYEEENKKVIETEIKLLTLQYEYLFKLKALDLYVNN